MLQLFTAIKVLWDSSTLPASFPGGIHASGEVPPNSLRPYVVAMPLTDAASSRSNRGRYSDLHFQLEVQADEFEQSSLLAAQLRDVILAGPLVLRAQPGISPERLVHVYEGTLTWQEEDLFWRVTIEFSGRVGRPLI